MYEKLKRSFNLTMKGLTYTNIIGCTFGTMYTLLQLYKNPVTTIVAATIGHGNMIVLFLVYLKYLKIF
jgi:hypothetical protein